MILLRLVLPMVMFLVVSCEVQNLTSDENGVVISKEIVADNEKCACVRAPCYCDGDDPREEEPYCFSVKKTFVRVFDDSPKCKDGKYIGVLPTIDPSCSESIRFETNCDARSSLGDVWSVGEYSVIGSEINVDDDYIPRIFILVDEKTIKNTQDGKLWKLLE